ncbi:methyl-accepting chemotaxis protein [Gemmata sp. JC717]|nr:methyl-accepting chemotaxis protein [Gemmata algarum]MDY3556018.1 methyl-accepting chemotaxis protein [Gemmata algarum]
MMAPTDTARAPEVGVVLDVLSAQLGETARHIEGAVAQVCTSFASIARRSKEGAARAARAAGAAAGPGADAQVTARATIATLLTRMDQVRRAADEAVATLHRIEGIAGRVDRIQRSLDDVDAVAYALRILAVNARVEAARAGPQGRGFAVVAAETGRQAEAILGTAKSVRGMVDGLWGEVRESARRMRAALLRDDGAAELNRAAEVSREEGARALDALARAQADMQAEVKAGAAGAEQLAGDIEDAMTALQFQDAVNQQLDHVAAALREARDALSDDPARGAQLLERLRARATMQSERRVVDRVTAPEPTSEAGDASGSFELF